jgi:hypothetical protein
MLSKHGMSRRLVLQTGAAAVSLVVFGCRGKQAPAATCTDTNGMAPDDVAPRSTLAYQDRATDPTRACDKCVQFVEPASAGTCGACKVLKGPISPAGSCKVFAAKG